MFARPRIPELVDHEEQVVRRHVLGNGCGLLDPATFTLTILCARDHHDGEPRPSGACTSEVMHVASRTQRVMHHGDVGDGFWAQLRERRRVDHLEPASRQDASETSTPRDLGVDDGDAALRGDVAETVGA